MLKAIPLNDYKKGVHDLPIAVQPLKKGFVVAIENTEDGFIAGVLDAANSFTAGYYGLVLGDYEQDEGCLIAAKGTIRNVDYVWIVE